MGFIVAGLFWILVIGFSWFWWFPKSFGRTVGNWFLKSTKGGQPKEVSGLKILGQLIFGIVVTIIFFNIHPVTIFPIGFFWIQWIRMMNKTSKAAHPEEQQSADGGASTTASGT